LVIPQASAGELVGWLMCVYMSVDPLEEQASAGELVGWLMVGE
jgi:hypothetical protein